MTTDEERCTERRRIARIERAFRAGDLHALREAVGDAALVPNGQMPAAIGTCLAFAIGWSPLPFIRTLLEIGADPNGRADDGFPPLIAAIGSVRDVPGGANRRHDVDSLVRLLLRFGADPNVRGINDYTPLHMAVAERSALCVLCLLDGGADRTLRTRIDDCETPLEMARAAGLTEIVALLDGSGERRLRPGLTMLADITGRADPVRRQHHYRVRFRMRLASGEPVRWQLASIADDRASVEEDGETLVTEVRLSRGALVNGLFTGMDGMRIGGTRRLRLAPHLAYGERGVPGVIPPGATLVTDVTVLEDASRPSR
jgi:hypothetical protein